MAAKITVEQVHDLQIHIGTVQYDISQNIRSRSYYTFKWFKSNLKKNRNDSKIIKVLKY